MTVRLARAITGKNKILKFEGCYHGWIDDVMVSVHPENINSMGLEEAPKAVAEGPGQSKVALSEVIVAPINRPEILERIFHESGNEIATLILEPLPVNNGVIPPKEGFLELLRELTRKHNCLLIFDETITGFRMGIGGAQEYYGVIPDLTVFGKSIGGGYPIAGFGGKRQVMDLIAKQKVGRAGTYNSNSLCVSASIAVLTELMKDNGAIYKRMATLGTRLMKGLEQIIRDKGIPVSVVGPGHFFSVFFTDKSVETYRDAFSLKTSFSNKLWRGLLEREIRVRTSVRGTWFLSGAHTDEDIALTLERVSDTISNI